MCGFSQSYQDMTSPTPFFFFFFFVVLVVLWRSLSSPRRARSRLASPEIPSGFIGTPISSRSPSPIEDLRGPILGSGNADLPWKLWSQRKRGLHVEQVPPSLPASPFHRGAAFGHSGAPGSLVGEAEPFGERQLRQRSATRPLFRQDRWVHHLYEQRRWPLDRDGLAGLSGRAERGFAKFWWCFEPDGWFFVGKWWCGWTGGFVIFLYADVCLVLW